jgi:hypothetical protein
MEQFDKSIITLSLQADMVAGYFHELLGPWVVKSLSRSLEKIGGQELEITSRLINDLKQRSTDD